MRRPFCGSCATVAWVYALGMLLSVSAAENPCAKTWQWQWQEPELNITGPSTIPNQCVGPISVGPATVTPTPGRKWEEDISTCTEPPKTRSETDVPISPVNTWWLYSCPPGTTPTSGSGETANFTTVHGGNVVVQFETRATLASPPWDSGVKVHRTSPFTVFEVASLVRDVGLSGVDEDSDSSTSLYVVSPPRAAPGTITIRATPNPLVSAGELPTCWTLSGSSGVTIVNKLTATLNGSVPGTHEVICQSGTSYRKAKIVVVRLLPVEFKRNDEPASFFSVDGGGDVVLNESFNWRMLVEGDTAAIAHILKWEVRGPNMNRIALGDGLAFTRTMAPLGGHTVQFWIDLNDDDLALGVEPKQGNLNANVVNLVDIPLVIKRHTSITFSNSDADTLLASGTTLLRTRDQIDDRRCGVRLLRTGNVGTFTSPQSVATEVMYNQVKGISGNIKIVQSIIWPGPPMLGRCFALGSMNIVMDDGASVAVWAHEIGHGRGILGDYETPTHRIMCNEGGNTLSESERLRYRTGL